MLLAISGIILPPAEIKSSDTLLLTSKSRNWQLANHSKTHSQTAAVQALLSALFYLPLASISVILLQPPMPSCDCPSSSCCYNTRHARKSLHEHLRCRWAVLCGSMHLHLCVCLQSTGVTHRPDGLVAVHAGKIWTFPAAETGLDLKLWTADQLRQAHRSPALIGQRLQCTASATLSARANASVIRWLLPMKVRRLAAV